MRARSRRWSHLRRRRWRSARGRPMKALKISLQRLRQLPPSLLVLKSRWGRIKRCFWWRARATRPDRDNQRTGAEEIRALNALRQESTKSRSSGEVTTDYGTPMSSQASQTRSAAATSSQGRNEGPDKRRTNARCPSISADSRVQRINLLQSAVAFEPGSRSASHRESDE